MLWAAYLIWSNEVEVPSPDPLYLYSLYLSLIFIQLLAKNVHVLKLGKKNVSSLVILSQVWVMPKLTQVSSITTLKQVSLSISPGHKFAMGGGGKEEERTWTTVLSNTQTYSFLPSRLMNSVQEPVCWPHLLSRVKFIAEALGPMSALALLKVNLVHPLQEVSGTSHLRMKI